MPYVAEKDATLPREIARGSDPEGNEYTETESVVYPAGSVIQDDDLAPNVRERLESGDDDHLSSLVRHVSEKEAQKILAERSEGLAVAPEHEAEAEVLYQDGQDVLTREEVVETNPNGDPPDAVEEAPDLSEGREADDESIRSTEVDKRRRGKGKAPESKAAAKPSKKSRAKKKDEDESNTEKSE